MNHSCVKRSQLFSWLSGKEALSLPLFCFFKLTIDCFYISHPHNHFSSVSSYLFCTLLLIHDIDSNWGFTNFPLSFFQPFFHDGVRKRLCTFSPKVLRWRLDTVAASCQNGQCVFFSRPIIPLTLWSECSFYSWLNTAWGKPKQRAVYTAPHDIWPLWTSAFTTSL